MALAQKHRDSLFRSLSPVVGEEEAEALLVQFPAREADEPATKEFVHAEIAGVRTEIADVRTEIAGVRADVAESLRKQTLAIATIYLLGSTVMGSVIGLLMAMTAA